MTISGNQSATLEAPIKREVRFFFTALMYFTRIPCPNWIGYSPSQLAMSRTYFPVIGYVVALLCFVVYALMALVLPNTISVVLSMCAGVFVTGAFHEDGFADVCDSFGGGYGKKQILTIMKDSRVGAYGAIGMMLILLLKFQVLVALSDFGLWVFAMALLLAHSASRLAASYAVQMREYVQDIDQSKIKPIAIESLSGKRMMLGWLVVLLPLVALMLIVDVTVIFVLALPVACFLALLAYFTRHIGGYTGDCLGTIQQVCEVALYLGVLVVCRSI